MNRAKVRLTWLFVLAGLAFLIANQVGYESELQEQSTYCQMVSQHVWPDYKHDFKRVCK